MRIKIDFLPATREAIITTDETGRAWTSVLRACQDNAESDLISTNEKSITLPWWSFLLAREAIGYHLAIANASVDFSDKARELLQEALKRTDLYSGAANAVPISEDTLNRFLKDAGFVRPLTNEQKNNVRKIASLPAAATFSVPGAGKTTEALAYFCCRKTAKSKLLIVCPKNAFAVW